MGQDSVSISSTKGSLTSVIWATFRKYGIIFLGYAVSLALFIVTSMFDVLGSFMSLGEFWAFIVDRMVFGTMLFCGFLIMYLVREQKLERLQNKLAEEQKLRDGIRIAENEVRNQIILIHQAAFVLLEKKEYDEEIVQVIRENTLKMDKQLGLLQSGGVEFKDDDSESVLVLF
jgi:hypothetical protein